MTHNTYFTPSERKELLGTVKYLINKHKGLASRSDINQIDDLLREGVVESKLERDSYGVNPVLRHLRTSRLLTELVAADRSMTIACLLYQLCRKDERTLKETMTSFGDDVSRLMRGLIKVSQLYSRQTAVRDENFQKLLLTFAEDIRVIIIMIVDRLGLMRVINNHPDTDFVRRIALESRYLYAPLAHRLGLYQIKSELEDLSLKYLNRKVYEQIAEKLNATKQARDQYVADFIMPVRKALEREGMRFEIKGRPKSINSIWNKMRKKDVDLGDIYDLFAIRIILDSPPEQEKKDCWVVYSIVTDMYTGNQSRMRDWITIPKSNGYESLHATVKGPDGKWVEVQIRTRRMDEIAERGLAAHWKYKGIKSEENLDTWMNNVREVLEAGKAGQMELVRTMNMNLYDNEVFVFTPKGDLYRLPQGATVLDFAFAIHSRVGSTCVGARVDGKNQRLGYRLQNGDTVEVLTSSTQSPRLDWLSMVVTSRARNKIKVAVNEARARQAEMARELLQRRLKNRKIAFDEATLMKLVKRLGYKTLTDFLVDIHKEKIDATNFVEQYEQALSHQGEPAVGGTDSAEAFVLHTPQRELQPADDVLEIGDKTVKGLNYKLSKCCNPIYGDKIVGFVSSDGAIKIHRAACGNVRHLIAKYPYRMIRTRWSGKIGSQFAASIRVVGRDDIGIVSNITSLINKTNEAVLRNIAINSLNGEFEGHLVVSVPSLTLLDDLIAKIQALKGVHQVARDC
ncbi:MAG: bifunctional (p)ppGpp synthetase/guanosine-3',5'-bis(diphosphate) 3'-pyrophosphohydrolase [Muribaculaceae bacterium]|nr:bifunctional (p)ppGpp synthetase/guanosine-3',5'-bis(diphosphate) 3'-pyrophosphohydrolase [Muribaculaceae bacterium]